MTDTVHQPATRPVTTPSSAPTTAPQPDQRIDAATIRSAFGLLREPFWAKAALAVVLLSVAFYYLGRWQLGRHEGVVAENNLIQANYFAAPVPLDTVLPTPDSPLPKNRQWAQVRMTGVYEPQHQVVIRNRPLNDSFGFEVMLPLRLSSGAAVMIDRGWVATAQNTVDPGPIPAAPSGEVTVVARVRPGEPPLNRTPPPGQELRIDLGRLAAIAGGTVYRGAYGLLVSETPAPAVSPAQLPEPVEDLGMHLAYAVQWWIGDVAAYVLLIRYALREVQVRAAAGPGEGPGGADPSSPDAASGDPAAPGSPGPRIPASLRAAPWSGRRRGPTDEEYEDAACD